MQLKEILVLHHSHFDIGYTHSQPILWELQREYIDQALDLLDQTADWSDGPKWTCEVTAPVLKWIETATEEKIARFAAFVREGRLAIGAMRYHITPLNSAGQLSRQLEPVGRLRELFGARITTAIQHDVTGVPWPLADILLDRGIELFVMGVNRCNGGVVQPRPGVFRWRTPSGRELRVMNGNHYTMFDQILLTWERSLDAMQRGLADYMGHLDRIQYPHDFLYLTTTASPEMWDNSPPNPGVAGLIRQWNDAGMQPPIRYVTTEDLLERIRAIPDEELPLLSGDWTDYWNFGCASTAANVAWSREARRMLDAAGRIASTPLLPAVRQVAERAHDLLDLYNEHTWSYWETENFPEPARVQDLLKAAPAVEARELARYVLTAQLEAAAANPPHSETPPDHVLLFNPAPVARTEYVAIPTAWRKPGPRLRCERFTPPRAEATELCGPVELPAYGVMRLPLASLTPVPDDTRVRHEDQRSPVSYRAFNNVRLEIERQGAAVIETPAHRLTYNPETGAISGLFDKALDWEVIPEGGPYDFFDFVRERPDPLANGGRSAYSQRNLDKEKFDESCWKHWRAIRERPTRCLECNILRNAGSVTLERQFDAPGTAGLRHQISFRADSPIITIEVEIEKLAYPDPEAIYFALPLNLGAGWRCHFDTAGLPVELDAEQLPGACRGWFTTESYVAMHDGRRGVTLFCPDAPMAMAGGFNFGPPLKAVPRDPNPLLLAWPVNNYWNTNFPVIQPGRIQLRYGLQTHAAFNPAVTQEQAALFANPIIVHPAYGDGRK